MMYVKPSDLRFTDMCIYIDEHVYTSDFDAEKIFEYIFHIVRALALRANFFNKCSYYDDFSIFAATKIYMRLINKKQYQIKSDGTPKLKKIKSILNYIKTILYPLKVDFEQSEYYQGISLDDLVENYDYGFYNIIENSIDRIGISDFKLDLDNICTMCKEFVNTLPHKKDSVEAINIYISILLTFLNQIILDYKNKVKIENCSNFRADVQNNIFNNILDTQKYSDPVLFHLDSSMNNYIEVLCRQFKTFVLNELSESLSNCSDVEFLVYKDELDEC